MTLNSAKGDTLSTLENTADYDAEASPVGDFENRQLGSGIRGRNHTLTYMFFILCSYVSKVASSDEIKYPNIQAMH